MAAIVVVSPLEETVTKILKNTPDVQLVFQRKTSDHAVFHFRFTRKPVEKPLQSALERGVYTRSNSKFQFNDLEYPMQTAYGLPEFDSLSYRSELTMKFLKSLKIVSSGQVEVLNPGQGHIPVVLARLFHPARMALIDRDLLALRISKLNLTLNGCPAGFPAGNPDDQIEINHEVGITHSTDKGNYDLLVLLLREEEGNEANLLTLRQAANTLTERGTLLVTASSTSVTRLAVNFRSLRLRARTRDRWKGISLVVLEHI